MTGIDCVMVGGGNALAVFSADPIDASRTVTTPTNATATVTFKRNGEIRNHGGTLLGYWTDKPYSTVGDAFKVKAAKSSGDAFSSEAAADNTYTTDISADRSYTLTNSSDTPGTLQWVGNWTVANLAATQTDSAAGTVTATVDP